MSEKETKGQDDEQITIYNDPNGALKQFYVENIKTIDHSIRQEAGVYNNQSTGTNLPQPNFTEIKVRHTDPRQMESFLQQQFLSNMKISDLNRELRKLGGF